jgi:serine protease Do
MKKYLLLPFLITLISLSSPLFAQQEGIESLRQTGKAFTSVAQKVSPSVVYIQAIKLVKNNSMRSYPSPFGPGSPFNDELLRRFFGDRLPGLPDNQRQSSQPRSIGQGSGFIFSVEHGVLGNKAYILTNNHVVEDADEIKVKLQDGQEYTAKIKGTDPKSDIAVLEIKAKAIPALTLGDSNQLEVGEWVVAIGNPFGLNHTLTVGVVSAKGRTSLGISDYEDFIQTDAAINPGNSGGPLVNLDGEVVGINTAIFSRSGGYMGVGFAIPINMAKGIANQLLDDGEVSRGYLGVSIQPMTQELANSFDMNDIKGILVTQVVAASPAERAGLQQGDLIVSFEGDEVSDVGDFRNRVSLTEPGKSADLVVIRDGREKKITVKIGKLDGAEIASGPTVSSDELGLTVQTLTRDLAKQLRTESQQGVVVTSVTPGSIAAMAGIEPGSVILQVNRKTVADAGSFRARIKESLPDKRILLLLSQNGMSRYLVLRW